MQEEIPADCETLPNILKEQIVQSDAVICLANGGWTIAEEASFDRQTVHWKSPIFGPVETPQSRVRGMLFYVPADARQATLEVGKLADLIVISEDIFTIDQDSTSAGLDLSQIVETIQTAQ